MGGALQRRNAGLLVGPGGQRRANQRGPGGAAVRPQHESLLYFEDPLARSTSDSWLAFAGHTHAYPYSHGART